MVRLTRHGWREILIGTLVLAIMGFVLGWVFWPLALIVVPVVVWLFAFFRDPERAVPEQQHAMVSPADGVVSDITDLEHYDLLNGPAMRVGIFLSVFNVHINRSPCDGIVSDVIYKKGKFINAMNHNAASEDNESNTVVIVDSSGRSVAVVKQIVGLIARRIIFIAKTGDSLKRGQRIGMIKFGSRTELYIPKSLEPGIRVTVGQKVRGAADVIAVLGKPVESPKPPVDEDFERLAPRETPA